MEIISVKSQFEQAEEFYQDQKKDKPDYEKVIDTFKKFTVIEPSNYDEEKVVYSANRRIGDTIDKLCLDKRKISSASIEYYDRAVKGFEKLIQYNKTKLDNMKNGHLVLWSIPKPPITEKEREETESDLNEFRYLVGATLLRIVQIKQDKLNTEKSLINNQLDKNEDLKGDLEKAIRVLNQVDSKDKYLKIITYNMLGVINFTLYELSSVKDNLSAAIFLFEVGVGLDFDENNKKEKRAHYLALNNKGYALYRDKRFVEAKDNLYQRYKYDNSANACAHIADTYLNLKDYETALEFYQKAKAISDGNPNLGSNPTAVAADIDLQRPSITIRSIRNDLYFLTYDNRQSSTLTMDRFDFDKGLTTIRYLDSFFRQSPHAGIILERAGRIFAKDDHYDGDNNDVKRIASSTAAFTE